MSNSLRRIYNSIDKLFDVSAITQELRYSRDGGEGRTPQTALQAFKFVKPVILELDRQFQLKMVTSQQGLTANGASAHWEFFFNLFRRRAVTVCEWILSWNEAIDDYGQAKIEITVNPFPAVNSPIRSAVREGKLLHRQMIGLWWQECKRRPTLPTQFRDTESALADFVRQGLDITQTEFSLSTGGCWHMEMMT
jgi:hypothetical protein